MCDFFYSVSVKMTSMHWIKTKKTWWSVAIHRSSDVMISLKISNLRQLQTDNNFSLCFSTFFYLALQASIFIRCILSQNVSRLSESGKRQRLRNSDSGNNSKVWLDGDALPLFTESIHSLFSFRVVFDHAYNLPTGRQFSISAGSRTAERPDWNWPDSLRTKSVSSEPTWQLADVNSDKYIILC